MPRTILIVDDIMPNRLILKGMLRKDYGILEATNGEDALAVLAERHEAISAVLLDISMPGIDGYEVLRRVRADKKLSSMPVIMITGSEDEASRVKSLALGANDYVMKPYSAEIIKHCLRNNIALREAAATVSALTRDKLTGLYTRETFFEKVRQMVAEREPGYYVMGCVDIDNFKVINDQFGVEMGDRVLVHMANNLERDCEDDGSICGRIAADNFAVLYEERLLRERKVGLRENMEAIVAGAPQPFTVSIGRYVISDKSLPVSAMYDRAVIARKTVKGRSDAHIAVYDETMRSRIIREQEIVSEMRAALEDGQFEPWFQPQYNHATRAMIGSEALVRWRHPHRGLVPPNEFIPIFEQNGFIYEMDKSIWAQVCRCLRKWIDEGRAPLPVSVNISRYDIVRPDLIETISGLVRRYGLPRELLRLEVTESAFSTASQQIVSVVKALIDLGFTVEIDDFGSGYSSLNTLKDVPAQIIKLDMRFLENSEDSRRGGNIVESVVRMAKWLNVSVIAEGVETVEQANYLRSIGCDYLQGYLYARPMPLSQYEAHCRGGRKEERLLAVETVEHMDSNAFWDPKSMDTLIFNSYVGAACIFEYRDDKIEVIRTTDRFAAMIGGGALSAEETLRMDWSAHLDGESARKLKEAIQASRKTSADVPCELLFLSLPGCPQKTYIRATMRVIATTGDRCLVYNLVENITARREAEREARETAEQMAVIMASIRGGISAVTVGEGGQIRFAFANARYYEILGYTKEQFEAEVDNAIDLVFKEDLDRVNAAMRRVMETRKPDYYEYRCRRRDGSTAYLRCNAACTSMSGVGDTVLLSNITDITEVVAAREKEASAQRDLLDNMPYGAALYSYDGENIRAVHINRRYWELVEREPEDYGKMSVAGAIHPDDRPRMLEELRAAIGEARAVKIEMRIRRGPEGYAPFRVIANVERKESGEYLMYAAYEPVDPDALSYQQALPLLLSAVMNATNDFAFAKDKDFRYISASRAFLGLAERNDEREIVGKTDFDLFPADMAEQFRRNDIALLESGKSLVDYEETIHAPDGALHYCRASKYPLRDPAGQIIGLYGVSRDITEERGAFERLKLVNDSVPGGIATYSFKDGVMRIVYCNDGFCALFGGTREGFARRAELNPLDWVHEDDRAILRAQIDALVKDDAPMDCVYRVKLVGGGYKWISEKAVATERRGDTVFFNAVLLDINERQLINEQLRISEEENNLAVAHSGSLVCRYSVAERTLSMAASSAAKYGLPTVLTDVPYEPVRQGLISPETADAYIGFFEAILKGNTTGTVLFQQRYLGAWQWEEAKSSTVFADDGTPVKAVVSMINATERIEKENIYRKWQQSLTDRTPSTYTLFRTNISHRGDYDAKEGELLAFDFDRAGANDGEVARAYAAKCVCAEDRDAYVAFVNADSMLASYYRGRRSDSLEYREILPNGGTRWLRLTVDLVEYPNSSDVEAYMMYEDIDEAKKTELKTKALSETDPLTGILNRATFAERVNRILQGSGPEAKHALMMLDIDGFKQVNDVFGHGAGDRTLIDLANGLKSMMRHDDLVARLGGDEFVVFLNGIHGENPAIPKARQIRSLARKAFSMEVQISASIGIALSPHDGTDFDTLYKKADSALYYVKGSGKDNQALYSESMADEHLAPEPDTLENGGATLAEKKRRMLIVDDSNIDHAFLQNIFRDEFIMEKAKDGNTALIRLRHYGSAISVMLLDLVMPGMDGFAVLEKMQESAELRSIPVIIVSGDESRETCLKAIRKGATDFITKPVDVDLLRIRVHSAISRAENERLRAQNSLLEVRSREQRRYEAFLESPGITFIEHDWLGGGFTYYPSISNCLWGTYDSRPLWRILSDDGTADAETVMALQKLVRRVAEAGEPISLTQTVALKTPRKKTHGFRAHARKIGGEYPASDRILLTLTDLEYAAEDAR